MDLGELITLNGHIGLNWNGGVRIGSVAVLQSRGI